MQLSFIYRPPANRLSFTSISVFEIVLTLFYLEYQFLVNVLFTNMLFEFIEKNLTLNNNDSLILVVNVVYNFYYFYFLDFWK